MKSKILFLTLAVLLCLTVQIYALSNMAKGQCGTNPLGDTSGDTDFYVSKNQNAPASGMSSAASSSGKAAVALGSTAVKNATIQSLNPDKPSPQGPGVAIVWKVEAANPNNEKMLYDYLLKGPATGNRFLDKTGWIRESSWTWNTTDADAGENQIEVRVMRAGASGFEDSMTQSFIVSAATQNSEAAAVDTAPLLIRLQLIRQQLHLPRTLHQRTMPQMRLPKQHPSTRIPVPHRRPQTPRSASPELHPMRDRGKLQQQQAG